MEDFSLKPEQRAVDSAAFEGTTPPVGLTDAISIETITCLQTIP